MSGPLKGLKVIEMAGLGPCPLAGQLLGDLGADVILVDRNSAKPDMTDINRRSKRSIALDLKKPEAVTTLMRLIGGADILIEGFRPGVMEKLGLGPQECHATNPGLVYGRMTGWGQSGPLSKTAGHDINYLAITGVLNAIGLKDRPPVPPLNMVADYAGGTMFLLFGILSALYEKQHSGKGQVVDAAMVDAIPLLAGLMQSFDARGHWSDDRQSNLLDGGAPFYRCFETADGKYVSIGSLEPKFFAELVQLTGLDEDVAVQQLDSTTWDQKHATLEAIFMSKTRSQWEKIFEGSDACFAPVLNWHEAHDHPHNLARNIFIAPNNITQTAPAPRFDRTPAGPPKDPATPGEAGDTVLTECGMTIREISDLRISGALK